MSEQIKKPTEKKQVTKTSLAYQRDKDREMVRGIFRYYEVPGGMLEFVYGPIYPGDHTEKYSMLDGTLQTIPLGVAKHLNKNGWYPIHMHATDKDGNPSMRINQKVRRFGFQSTEFVDVEELNMPNGPLITVETTAGL
jgi:hypothetical protein